MRPFWTAKRKLRRTHLLGAPLAGFHGIFDESFGDPKTPKPYPRVTPSRIGNALLPFRCPACKTVVTEFSDATERAHYTDAARGFSWCPCPDCRSRFVFNEEGMPLPSSLPAEALVAPCRTERGNIVTVDGSGAARYNGLDELAKEHADAASR